MEINTMTFNFTAFIESIDKRAQFAWIPACNGTEPIFTKADRRYQYLYNTVTDTHAYYCLDTDLFLDDAEAERLLA